MRLTRLAPLAVLPLLFACGNAETTDPTPTTPEGPVTPEAPAGYQGSDTVADGGTISGTVTYTGDQTDAMLTPDKDVETCGHEHPERPAGALLVNDGKLANAVVYLPDVSAGKTFDVGITEVDNVACDFVPHVALGQVKGQVAAINSDPVLHNTNITLVKGKKKIANIALPKQGQRVEKPLKKAGLVDIRCDAHSWMQGYIFVAANPYVVLTDADGAFSLSDVPAGEHTATVWHELLGEKEMKVTVTAGGTATLDVAYE